MSKESNIKYSPSLSIAENAKRNGVTEDAIRYYIRTRGVDRRYEEKKKVLKSMKDYLKEHPNASKAEVARQSGRGINTVVRYWDILQGKAKLQPNERKANLQEQRVEAIKNRHIAYLDKLPVEFIREYLAARETANNAPKEVVAEVVEVAKQAPVEAIEVSKKAKTPKKVKEKTPKKEKAKAAKEPKTKKPKAPKANSIIRCTDKYVYFFQDTPLSNWWASNPHIPYDGHEFGSSEALFMYLKAKGMGDDKAASKILALDDNTTLTDKQRFAKAQMFGKKCKYNEEVFFANREKWMYTALSAKYEVDEEFRSVLMSDKYRGLTFVEASPSDVNWGIGLSATKAYAGEKWNGLNLLGKLLTQLRDEHLKDYRP